MGSLFCLGARIVIAHEAGEHNAFRLSVVAFLEKIPHDLFNFASVFRELFEESQHEESQHDVPKSMQRRYISNLSFSLTISDKLDKKKFHVIQCSV